MGDAQGWLQGQGVGAAVQSRVLRIVAAVGFKDELAGGGLAQPAPLPLEAAVVQDADRWDALLRVSRKM